MSIKTGKICPKCKSDDSREFKFFSPWVKYVCPRCSHMWEERKEKKDEST